MLQIAIIPYHSWRQLMPTRRTVLFSWLALALAGRSLPLFAQPAVSLDDFLSLSARLAGLPVSVFDRQAAHFMLDAYRQRGLMPDLIRLASQTDLQSAALHHGTDGHLANELLAAWYSGVCMTVEGPVVVTYTSALIWGAAPFIHPQGACGGATGYWSEPPTT